MGSAFSTAGIAKGRGHRDIVDAAPAIPDLAQRARNRMAFAESTWHRSPRHNWPRDFGNPDHAEWERARTNLKDVARESEDDTHFAFSVFKGAQLQNFEYLARSRPLRPQLQPTGLFSDLANELAKLGNLLLTNAREWMPSASGRLHLIHASAGQAEA